MNLIWYSFKIILFCISELGPLDKTFMQLLAGKHSRERVQICAKIIIQREM